MTKQQFSETMKPIEIPFENGCYNLTYARCMYILAHDGLFTLDGRVYGVLTFENTGENLCWGCEMDCLCTPQIGDLCAQFDLLTNKTCIIDIAENL